MATTVTATGIISQAGSTSDGREFNMQITYDWIATNQCNINISFSGGHLEHGSTYAANPQNYHVRCVGTLTINGIKQDQYQKDGWTTNHNMFIWPQLYVTGEYWWADCGANTTITSTSSIPVNFHYEYSGCYCDISYTIPYEGEIPIDPGGDEPGEEEDPVPNPGNFTHNQYEKIQHKLASNYEGFETLRQLIQAEFDRRSKGAGASSLNSTNSLQIYKDKYNAVQTALTELQNSNITIENAIRTLNTITNIMIIHSPTNDYEQYDIIPSLSDFYTIVNNWHDRTENNHGCAGACSGLCTGIGMEITPSEIDKGYSQNTGCGNSCSGGCKTVCHGCSNTCSGCKGACTKECQAGCGTTSQGYIGCAGGGCSSSCADACTNCQNQCSGVCSDACASGCSGGCAGNCWNTCASCSNNCQGDCSTGCQGCGGTCSGVCGTSCEGICQYGADFN